MKFSAWHAGLIKQHEVSTAESSLVFFWENFACFKAFGTAWLNFKEARIKF